MTRPGGFPADQVEPFTSFGDGAGVLLLHGFGGTPASMRPWADDLVARGYSVSVPLLPGHGTTWRDLAQVPWTQWYAAADAALSELRGHGPGPVAVAGLSMGGCLALRLAALRPADVSRVMLVNPSMANQNKLMFALPLIRRFMPSIPNDGPFVKKPGVPRASYERLPLKAVQSMTGLWKDTRGRLPQVGRPVLLFRSVADGPSGEHSGAIVLGGVGSAVRREVLLHDSYHLATLDNDNGLIFAESARFLSGDAEG